MFHIRQENSYYLECTVNVARLIKCFNYPTGSPIVILKGIRYINFVSKTLGFHQKVVAAWADFVQVRNVTAICWKPCCNTQTAHLWSQQIWKKLQNREDAYHVQTCPGWPLVCAAGCFIQASRSRTVSGTLSSILLETSASNEEGFFFLLKYNWFTMLC